MRLEHYIPVGKERLRCGYTTGTCAAAAARGAAEYLLTGRCPAAVEIRTPAGICVTAELEEVCRGGDWASCAVRKDGGDDPDVTDGILIYAKAVCRPAGGIVIAGGAGVGRVTRPGLDQPVGEAAINSTPRRMIRAECEAALKAASVSCGLTVTISAPAGVGLAAKTFNPRLGIEGGISILGTSGIVRPMSEAALVDSLYLELDQLYARGGRDVLVTPGNYGADFARTDLGLSLQNLCSCSNYLGNCIDYAAGKGFRSFLLVSHLGKLSKVAAGNFNTHSAVSDGRRESLCTHAALSGGAGAVIRDLYDCVTTEAALDRLRAAGLLEDTLESLMGALDAHLTARAGGMTIGAVAFTKQHGLLAMTPGAAALLPLHRGEEETR
ncbi:cobalt-precorrin-5B (C(1))-methyltransferase CbiD [Pseudoflavonifractor phocaeensis]|uniref:cobalt-precorrin-5B (C(1))-methyltransferase CbiD n=1 Tax=Pseudoflavonifractor phocaeensis TaxID=1870988 RepID=UPI0030B901E1